jgi:YggT family protein
MFILGNLLFALATIIHGVLTVYIWIIIARVIVSWVNADPYNPIVRFLYQITEPVLYWVRRILPFRALPIDLSPWIVLIVIEFLDYFLVRTIQDIAIRMR